MKNLITISLSVLFTFLTASLLFAQSPSLIEPYAIKITHQKTTNLVFSNRVVSVDKGSRDILVQKAKGADNILHLKAATAGFENTNLTVITADGRLHSYLLSYIADPRDLNFVFDNAHTYSPVISAVSHNEALVEAAASEIAAEGRTIKRKQDTRFGISLGLEGIFIHQDLLYYQLRIKNKTHVSYDISQLRFFIQDKKTSKRTANQQLELIPQYVHGNPDRVGADSESVLVFAMPKHTIPDKKNLLLQLMEKNGGRHLKLNVSNKTIVKALPFTAHSQSN
jgi:conjugative transposon TraN protein